MCGIAGYYGMQDIDEITIRTCLDLMHRRGPDNAEFKKWTHSSGNVTYLLHTRLSIIDLDPRANQPFNVNSKWITFNGELYNFVELRKELEDRGKRFSTNSDTEVLIRAIDHFGLSVLDKCEGMWAFAVYDEKDGSLTLCRDRFGEKPLYIYRDETGFYFGSEVKFIAALLGRNIEVDYDHIYRYLVNGYKALYKENQTFFVGVKEVLPATMSVLLPDQTPINTVYWKPSFSPREDMTYDEAVSGTRERLIRAVELRLRSDVPLAFCMSGGVDSNSLISIAKRVFHYNVQGFTIINTDPRYDEREMVDISVKKLGIKHISIQADTKDFLKNLRILIRQHDAPVSTISYYAHWLLMQSVADQGYRVSISGTAADELFTGYFDHHLMYLADIQEDPVLFNQAKQDWMTSILPIVRNRHLQDPELFIKDREFRAHIFFEKELVQKFLKVGWSEQFNEEKYTDNLLRNRMLNELFHESIPVILHEDDLNAMFFSIENRSPFLDRVLFEFCYTIPTKYLIKGGFAKAVLRDAMRGIVPDPILDEHRKVGFNAPIFDFLDINDPLVRKEILKPSLIFEHVRKEKIEELLKRKYLSNSESKLLFNFLNAKIFLEEFADN